MSSLVIYGNEFQGQFQNGLDPQSFKYRFLVEGDSWMDRSAMFHTSLLQELAPAMDASGEDVLIINIAMFGDTMRRIGDCVNVDFAQWVNTAFDWKFDAILLSAGGNDFIDAARDPDPGLGILKDLASGPLPAQGGDCIRQAGVADLVNQWLNPSFTALYQVIQSSRHAGVPIFLNNYDTPTARNAPAFPNGRAWLYEAFLKNSIPANLWKELTDSFFHEVQTTIAGWANARSNVYCVPTNGTLVPAQAGTTASSGDWLNEIHPNQSGWEKLALVWRTSIEKVLHQPPGARTKS